MGIRGYLAGENDGPGGIGVTALRNELLELTKTRQAAIDLCHEWIEEINRDFDEKATVINRKLRKLEGAQIEPAAQPVREKRVRTRKVSLNGTEDWSPEEIAHFKELANK